MHVEDLYGSSTDKRDTRVLKTVFFQHSVSIVEPQK